MKAKIISQYAGESAHFREINNLLTIDKYVLFRSLIAFVSIGGLKLIEDNLLKFLKKKHSFLDWIVGVEQGITSTEVLEYLDYLKSKYPEKVRIRIFTAGSEKDIFHPKIYWLGNKQGYSIIIGSSNLTDGGLLRNFEASTLLELNLANAKDKLVINDLEILWRKFSTPAPPMTAANLIELNNTVVKMLAKQDINERKRLYIEKSKFKHPFASVSKHSAILANIKRLHSDYLGKRKLNKSVTAIKTEAKQSPTVLIMDILQETRDTQVQIPVEVLGPFFNISNVSKKNEIILSEVLDGTVIKMDIRPFISQKNDTHRLEISGIKGLLRPLIIRFMIVGQQEYQYELITKSSLEYNSLNKLLSTKGKQIRKNARRWYLE